MNDTHVTVAGSTRLPRRRARHVLRACVCTLPLVIAFAVTGLGQSRGGQSAVASLGVALTPANFGSHSAADVENMFKLGKELGSHAVFIYQWSEPDLIGVARKMMDASRAAGLVPIIALSPTTLTKNRGALDVPDQVRRAAGKRLSFGEKSVSDAYVRDVLELARLKPPYLCLATEINMLALANLKEYLEFAKVYKQLYSLVKKTSPDTKVFVSFQWDIIRMMAVKEPDRIREHTKQIEVFRPQLDLVAFTSYPAELFDTPARIPADYYEGILQHVQRNEDVMMMEIGWPSTGKGTEQEQLAFVERLPALMAKVRPSVLAWSLLHDVRIAAFGDDLASTGLADTKGRRKPAFEALKKIR